METPLVMAVPSMHAARNAIVTLAPNNASWTICFSVCSVQGTHAVCKAHVCNQVDSSSLPPRTHEPPIKKNMLLFTLIQEFLAALILNTVARFLAGGHTPMGVLLFSLLPRFVHDRRR